jgi:hypothetical protein
MPVFKAVRAVHREALATMCRIAHQNDCLGRRIGRISQPIGLYFLQQFAALCLADALFERC